MNFTACSRIIFSVLFLATWSLLLVTNLQAQEALRFDSPPEKISPTQWRLTWTSQPGISYRLERSLNLSNWDPVATLMADATTASFTDGEVPLNADRVFWRAVRLGAADSTPPIVSILQARRISDNGSPSLELTVQATDNVAVIGVSYSETGVLLGAATEGPTGTWKRIVPIDLNSSNPRSCRSSRSGSIQSSPASTIT